MNISLPSRYEDLDVAFRSDLRPNKKLLRHVTDAFKSIGRSKGIRFLPIYGKSGSGKSSAALELGTHLPEVKVFKLTRAAVESRDQLLTELRAQFSGSPLIAVIDQFEEVATSKSKIPKEFVESLALLDRHQLIDQDELQSNPMLFIWLTTDVAFQNDLVSATTRNKRILTTPNFELEGPEVAVWPKIIEDTFSFHNKGRVLADNGLLEPDLIEISKTAETIGDAIEHAGRRLDGDETALQDISKYQVVMLWPVTDSTRISRILQFTDNRQGYKLNWPTWFQTLNKEEQKSVEMAELNRARLYFDLRLVPIAAADLQAIYRPNDDDPTPKTAADVFRKTHFYSIVADAWNPDSYAPLREHKSKRADEARGWYKSHTNDPNGIGKSIAKALTILGIKSSPEAELRSPYAKVRADVLAERKSGERSQVLVELKAYAPDYTRPSSISQAVRVTLRKYAQFAGFLRK